MTRRACTRRASTGTPVPGPTRCRGASLVEILVAVLVLSVGLLGLASLQVRALRGSHSSVQRTQAVILAQYLLDLMRVDRHAALRGDYNTPAAPSWLCAVPTTSTPGLASGESQAWFAQVTSQLGRSGDSTTCVRVACDAWGLCNVELRWDDSASAGLPDQRLSLQTRL